MKLNCKDLSLPRRCILIFGVDINGCIEVSPFFFFLSLFLSLSLSLSLYYYYYYFLNSKLRVDNKKLLYVFP